MSLVLNRSRTNISDRFTVEPDSEERDDVDLRAIEGAVRTILQAIGEDPDRE